MPSLRSAAFQAAGRFRGVAFQATSRCSSPQGRGRNRLSAHSGTAVGCLAAIVSPLQGEDVFWVMFPGFRSAPPRAVKPPAVSGPDGVRRHAGARARARARARLGFGSVSGSCSGSGSGSCSCSSPVAPRSHQLVGRALRYSGSGGRDHRIIGRRSPWDRTCRSVRFASIAASTIIRRKSARETCGARKC